MHSRSPEVVGVAVTRPHVTRPLFDDGVIRTFSPGPALTDRCAPADPDFFARVTVDPEVRTLVWPNGLDLAPEVLHGDSSRRIPSASATSPLRNLPV
ncbi:MAG TPA: DUF2442 domain-containing protein [Acidimicrobiaceae bacterium]|nr:DUF2442 domain-containing protein [Acidimicrobiaceae bacterium]